MKLTIKPHTNTNGYYRGFNVEIYSSLIDETVSFYVDQADLRDVVTARATLLAEREVERARLARTFDHTIAIPKIKDRLLGMYEDYLRHFGSGLVFVGQTMKAPSEGA